MDCSCVALEGAVVSLGPCGDTRCCQDLECCCVGGRTEAGCGGRGLTGQVDEQMGSRDRGRARDQWQDSKVDSHAGRAGRGAGTQPGPGAGHVWGDSSGQDIGDLASPQLKGHLPLRENVEEKQKLDL